MNLLCELGLKYNTDKFITHKFTETYFNAFYNLRDKNIKLLEIGILNGGSIKMWKDFFPFGSIYAFDIEDKSHFSEERITIEMGDQTDSSFLNNVFGGINFDIIIDDGGHTMQQQQISLYHLLKRTNNNGFYVIEDLHTSLASYTEWCDIGKNRFGGNFPHTEDNSTLKLLLDLSTKNTQNCDNYYISPNQYLELSDMIDKVHLQINGKVSITSIITKKI